MVDVLVILDGASEPMRAAGTAVEAAARGIDPAPGERAWRVDVLAADGHRAGGPATAHAASSLAAGAPAHAVHRIGGAPDEAAHQRDAAGKVAVIERIDRELIAPVAQAVARAGGSLAICPDHGCDPATGEHDDEPVPHLRWPDPNGPAGRLTERAVAGLPVAELHLAAVA